MSSLTARVALAAARAAAQTQSRTVGLNVTETLAVVALLGYYSSISSDVPFPLTIFSSTHSQWFVGAGSCCSRGRAACSCSTNAHCWSKPRRSDRHCRTCSRHGAKVTTSCELMRFDFSSNFSFCFVCCCFTPRTSSALDNRGKRKKEADCERMQRRDITERKKKRRERKRGNLQT